MIKGIILIYITYLITLYSYISFTVIFYKVTKKSELANTESLALEETQALVTFSLAYQFITLFDVRLCLKTFYLICIVDSLILHSQQHYNLYLNEVHLTQVFFHKAHHSLLCLGSLNKISSLCLVATLNSTNTNRKDRVAKRVALNMP